MTEPMYAQTLRRVFRLTQAPYSVPQNVGRNDLSAKIRAPRLLLNCPEQRPEVRACRQVTNPGLVRLSPQPCLVFQVEGECNEIALGLE